MQPELWDQLKTEIQNKCVAYEYTDASDTSLAEFIVSLVKANKEPNQINEELTIMVGSDYDPNVTQWVISRKEDLENPQQPTPMEEDQPEPAKESQQEVQTPESRTIEATANSEKVEKPKSRIFSQAIGDALNNGKRSERLHRSNDRSRSRSRSPIKQSHRYDRSDRASRHELSSENREPNSSGTKTGQKAGDRPSVFDRLGGSKGSQIKAQISAQGSTHEEKESRKDKKVERCKYWPTCKNGEQCPYFHPSQICPEFPNCSKKASECMFIHPETQQSTRQKQQPPMLAQVPIPCKFFPYCSNPVCPYMHPLLPQQSYYMQGATFGPSGYKVQVPCKNGDDCTRPDCHFIHPRDPNPQAEIICKFDGACTRPNCFYKHTKQNNANVVAKPKENTNVRQFSVPEDEIEERIVVGNSADLISQSETQPKTQQESN